MKKFVLLILVLMLICVPIKFKNVYAEDTTFIDINANFSNDTMLVVLNEKYANLFKDYNSEDFPEINCVKVEELTQRTTNKIRNEVTKGQEISLSNYRRILKLTVKEKDKNQIIKYINTILGRKDVAIVEPEYYYTKASILPNDPEYIRGGQWAIDSIDLPSAWEYTTGSNNIKVGIIDTGIAGNQLELVKNTQNILHMDFTGENPESQSVPEDLAWHGTQIASIIGATTDNNNLMSGVCWDVSLVSLRVSDGDKYYASRVISAIDYATTNNIQVLNFSAYVSFENANGNINLNSVLYQAINNYPGLFVVAAGNNSSDVDCSEYYPAKYSTVLKNVITVGSYNINGGRSSFSNYGINSVNIYAPGESILTAIPTATGNVIDNGTSFAAPYVSGVAALMLSLNPSLTGEQLKSLIINNSDEMTINTLLSGQHTGRKLNALKAIKSVYCDIDQNGVVTGVEDSLKGLFVVPAIYDDIVVTQIGENVFKNRTELTSVILPNTITSIGQEAFNGCSNLTEINIPNSVTNIGASAFKNCTELTSVILPNAITSIGQEVFRGCEKLEAIEIPNMVTSIGGYAFEGCTELISVSFAEDSDLAIISESAFANTGILSITMPITLINIGNNAFANCGDLTTLHIERTIDDGLIISLGNGVFAGCEDLQLITFKDIVTLAEYREDINWVMYEQFMYCVSLDSILITDDETVNNINGEENTVYGKYFAPHTFAGVHYVDELTETQISELCTNIETAVIFVTTLEFYESLEANSWELYDTEFIVVTLVANETEMEIPVVAKDEYSAGYNIATEYLSTEIIVDGNQTTIGIEVLTQIVEWEYFPIVAPSQYKTNVCFLMGITEAIGRPVKVISEEEIEAELMTMIEAEKELKYWVFIDILYENVQESFTASTYNVANFSFYHNTITGAQSNLTYSNKVYEIKNKVDYLAEFEIAKANGNEIDYSLWEMEDMEHEDELVEESFSLWTELEYGVDESQWQAYLQNTSVIYVEQIVEIA